MFYINPRSLRSNFICTEISSNCPEKNTDCLQQRYIQACVSVPSEHAPCCSLSKIHAASGLATTRFEIIVIIVFILFFLFHFALSMSMQNEIMK